MGHQQQISLHPVPPAQIEQHHAGLAVGHAGDLFSAGEMVTAKQIMEADRDTF